MSSAPNLISLQHLASNATTTARDPEWDMIAVRGINPKLLENTKQNKADVQGWHVFCFVF